MNTFKRVKRKIGVEKRIIDIVKKGYNRDIAAKWFHLNKRQKKYYDKRFSKEFIDVAYNNGYLPTSLFNYGINDKNEIRNVKHINDLDYMELNPFNNSFVKWVGDHISTAHILKDYSEVIPSVLISIIKRNKETVIINKSNNKVMSRTDLINFVKEGGPYLLKPSFYNTDNRSYILRHSKGDISLINKNGKNVSWNYFARNQVSNYVVIKPFDESLRGTRYERESLELFVGNDIEDRDKRVLHVNHMKWDEDIDKYVETYLDVDNFTDDYGEITISSKAIDKVKKYSMIFSDKLGPLNYFSITFTLLGDDIRLESFNTSPEIPKYGPSDRLNEYLLNKSKEKKKELKKSYYKIVNKKVIDKVAGRYSRKGIRLYMQKLWIKALKDDLLNTKKISLKNKMWAWKRGFLSFRIHQYELTDDNYKHFLSDYDYYWLNRINGVYQIWLNDKATFRYTMEDFKELLPEYYFLLCKDKAITNVYAMPDYNKGFEVDIDSVVDMLKEKGLLAFKPSAGLHGDGFYKLEYTDGKFFVNAKPTTRDELVTLMESQRSFYVVTEYLFMAPELRKIYPNSINTLRMMVINNNKNEPRIEQCYMRIGSSKSGFTDNVAYGGIVANVNLDDGRYDGGERLVDHFYEECNIHPDTGVEIKGYVPEWDHICTKVLEISKSMPELEYMGFDVVVSDIGTKILEINIHQDLHKVAEFTDEIASFFRKKIDLKRKINNI